MKIKGVRIASVLFGLLLTAACVTVNIYFPAAAVEKTADEIVEDVYKQDRQDDQSSLLQRMLAVVGPRQAHAQEQATEVSNSAIRGLKEQISQRHGQLVPFYEQGVVGITNDGMLEVLDTEGLPLNQVAAVKRLVQADNADRTRLYQEVAKALDVPDQTEKVRDIFADKWREKARSGWKIQNDNGQWATK
ncbi:MAG: YdbL family protein [Desulfohalobiaceae bacterium]